MKGQTIHIATADEALRRALQARIERSTNGTRIVADGSVESATKGDVLIATPADCPDVECHLLTQRGVAVIILAPVVRQSERERYLRAGASSFIPMLVDSGELVHAIDEALASPIPMAPIRPPCTSPAPM